MATDFRFDLVSLGGAASSSVTTVVHAAELDCTISLLALDEAARAEAAELVEVEAVAFRPFLVFLLLLEAGVEGSGKSPVNSSMLSAINCCSWLRSRDCSLPAALRFLDVLRSDLAALLLQGPVSAGVGSLF